MYKNKCVLQQRRDCQAHPIEQLGTYDPMENHNGEKLVSLNLERIKYWMAKKARLSNPVAELLGMFLLKPSVQDGSYNIQYLKKY